jgi:Ulp1 family protease
MIIKFLFSDVELNSYDIVVIPIGNGCHWTVAVALMKQHRIVLIDSLAGGESKARQLDHELLVEYFDTKGCRIFKDKAR